MDLVLIMSVNPGFGRQSFIKSQVKIISDLRRICAEKGVNPWIEVDGGVGPANVYKAILLNEDGAVLSSKYFKSAGCIKSGYKFEFSNYLVEICEAYVPGRETEGGLPEKHLEQVTNYTISNTEALSTPISIYNQKDSKVRDSKMDGSTNVNNRQICDGSQINAHIFGLGVTWKVAAMEEGSIVAILGLGAVRLAGLKSTEFFLISLHQFFVIRIVDQH